MKSFVHHIQDLFTSTTDLAEAKWKLYKIRVAQKMAEKMTSFVAVIFIAFFMFTALLILSVGAAYWIGSGTGNTRDGFFIVGGFYLLLGLLIYIFRNAWIKRPLSNKIVRKLVK